jgi:glycosyltransferase involved in cell wall biosynthesis
VAQWYDRARVFIAPTRFAAGIPHKAHEAAAFGLPMVTSTLVAGQLGWEPPALLHADDAAAFAAACVAMHDDEQHWSEARREALERVQRDCAPEVFAARVGQLVDDLQPAGVAPEAGL